MSAVRFAWLLAATSLLPPPHPAAAARAARTTKPGRAHAEATGTVLVRSTTTDAIVSIDGAEVGTIPMRLPLALKSGEHTIKVGKRGYSDFLDTFTVKGGQDVVLEIELLAVAGVLSVLTSVPEAAVILDGRQVGTSPFEADIDPGPHVLEVRALGHAPFKEALEVEAGKVYPLRITLVPMGSAGEEEETPWYGHWWVWAGAVAVVAGGVTAALLLADEEGSKGPADTVPIEFVP